MAIALSRHTQPFDVALRGVAWSLGLFGLLRLSSVETYALLPLTQLQGRLAEGAFGAPALPIEVTLACSGADALALCVGAILAYPVPWTKRVAGALGGAALIVVLNTIRIGTLGQASPSWFQLLHVYLWPGLLTLAVTGFVFGWMRIVDRPNATAPVLLPDRTPAPRTHLARTFVWLTAALVVIFTAASPLYLESAGVLAVAAFITRAAAVVLGVFGVEASAAGNLLSTAQGRFLVTQECVSTPLIPVYLAAVVVYSQGWRRRAPALLAVVPIFIALGIARLLVVALPPALIGSPTFLIHAFYQLLLAGVVVFIAAAWRHGAGATALQRTLLGGAAGCAAAYLLAPVYARAVTSAFGSGTPFPDPQGAIALLPAFQTGLYVALAVAASVTLGPRLFVTGFALLAASQVLVFAALDLLLTNAAFTPHVRDVRAWSLAGPLLVLAMLMYDRPRR